MTFKTLLVHVEANPTPDPRLELAIDLANQFDARLLGIGTCGKWGQSVPSSGGSHYFLALDPDKAVRLGGR